MNKSIPLFISNKSTAIVVMALSIFIFSCGNDDPDDPIIPDPATVNFSGTSLNIAENSSSPLTVNLSLSEALEEAGTVTISIDDGSTATSSDYSTDPAASSGTITLSLPEGTTSASFSVTPIDNSDLNEDKTIIFVISAADGGVELASSDLTATVTITNDDVTSASIAASVASLDDFGTVDNGNTSESKTYTVSGTDLTGDIAVAASDNFMVSLDNVTFSPSVNVAFNNANAGPVDVFVQFVPTSGTNQAITGNITHSATDAAEVTVTVSGTESGNAAADILLNENFEYGATAGDLTALSDWENYSGTESPIQYIVEGLSFDGYGSSAVGGAATFEGGEGSREDIQRQFTSQNSGTIYLAQVINISTAMANETGDFFLSLRDADDSFFNRFYAKDNGSGNLVLGIARSRVDGGTITFSTTEYSYNTNYLVVFKYDFETKDASMFVISGAVPATEPTTPDALANTGEEPAALEEIVIRQGADAIAGTIDGIRVATTWENALGL